MMRVYPLTVERGMGRQGDQLLGDEPLRLCDQLTSARLQRGIGGIRPDENAAPA